MVNKIQTITCLLNRWFYSFLFLVVYFVLLHATIAISSGSAVNHTGKLYLKSLQFQHVFLEVMVCVPGTAQCMWGDDTCVWAWREGSTCPHSRAELLPDWAAPYTGMLEKPLGFVWVCSKGVWSEVLKNAWKAVVCCRTLLYWNVLARFGLLLFFSNKQL